MFIRYDSYWLTVYGDFSAAWWLYSRYVCLAGSQCSSVVSYHWAVHVFNPTWNVLASQSSLRSLWKICNLFGKVIASYRIREIAIWDGHIFLISTTSYWTFILNHFSFFTALARENTTAEKLVLSDGTCKVNNTKLRFHICDAALNINGTCNWKGTLDHIKKIKWQIPIFLAQ